MDKKINKIINYLQKDKMFMHKFRNIHILYTTNQIIIQLRKKHNYYNKFIERTKNIFPNIKDMYYIKTDSENYDKIKIIL